MKKGSLNRSPVVDLQDADTEAETLILRISDADVAQSLPSSISGSSPKGRFIANVSTQLQIKGLGTTSIGEGQKQARWRW